MVYALLEGRFVARGWRRWEIRGRGRLVLGIGWCRFVKVVGVVAGVDAGLFGNSQTVGVGVVGCIWAAVLAGLVLAVKTAGESAVKLLPAVCIAGWVKIVNDVVFAVYYRLAVNHSVSTRSQPAV